MPPLECSSGLLIAWSWSFGVIDSFLVRGSLSVLVLALFERPMASLASTLEAERVVRNRVRENGKITRWPSDNKVGLPSVKAMKHNVVCLEHVARWWVQMSPVPCVIPIDRIRKEARNFTVILLYVKLHAVPSRLSTFDGP